MRSSTLALELVSAIDDISTANTLAVVYLPDRVLSYVASDVDTFVSYALHIAALAQNWHAYRIELHDINTQQLVYTFCKQFS